VEIRVGAALAKEIARRSFDLDPDYWDLIDDHPDD